MQKRRQMARIGWKGALSALGISLLWGGNITAIKITLGGVQPIMMAGLSFTLGALSLLPWVYYNGLRVLPSGREVHEHLINGLLFTLQIVLFYTGADRTTASHAVILTNTNIFFVSLLAHFFVPGDRLTFLKLAGLTVAFSGVAYLFWDMSSLKAGGASLSGNLIVLISAFLLAVRIVYLKHLIQRIDPAITVLWQMLIGTPLFYLLALFIEGTQMDLSSAKTLTALFYQGVVVSGFAFVASTLLLKRYPPSALSVFFFAVPVAGVVLSHWILGEAITLHIGVSVLMVALGISLVNYRRTVLPD